MRLVLQGGELLFDAFAFGSEFGTTLVEVTDEFLVRPVDEFHVAQESLALGIGVADGSTQGFEALLAFLSLCRVERAQVAVEQVVPGSAEDLSGQEVVKPVEEAVLADPEAGRMPFRAVLLLRGAHVVRRPDLGMRGLAEVTSSAHGADHIATQGVDPLGVRMRVRACGGAGALPALADLLSLDEGFQIDRGRLGRSQPRWAGN
ncbi:hypothetical protein [Streptomyces phytophilus]|uniref:hypothetical protein n=1 Tax=Streptomyces phytophilus TaxID=722715 RepID=UPI0015F04857|nr:hypothetical protein [Streptomyces phytophilus]